MKYSYSKSDILTAIAAIAVVGITYFRFVILKENVSFDHAAYINFFNAMQNQTLPEILEHRFLFPYVYLYGVAPFEIGFVIFSKLWSGLFTDPNTAYASMAAISVGLRVYLMRKLKISIIWILLLNVYAITLFEANALRLGIASSIVLYGLYCMLENRRQLGVALLVVATLFHLQTVIFVGPFVFSWFLRRQIVNSRAWLIMSILGLSVAAVIFTTLLPNIGNEKISEYVLRGTSGSAGLTLTSLLALFFLGSNFVARGDDGEPNNAAQIWAAITIASVPSLILFITLTNVAVVGDRSWQLAFLMCATFFFTDRGSYKQKRIPLIFLVALTLVVTINVSIRYPLSNFFSPVLPGISRS